MDVLHFILKEMPKISLILTILSILSFILCFMDILIPSYLHFSLSLIITKRQLWRLLTTFFYFGNVNRTLILHVSLLLRNSRLLERVVFKGNSADFVYCLIMIMTMLLMVNAFIGFPFMSYSLCFALTYYWGRMSRRTIVNFLGIVEVNAPYLPWFYLGISFLLECQFKEDLCGILVGHLYFYLKEIAPRLKCINNGHRKDENRKKGFIEKIMTTPMAIKRLCDWLELNNEMWINAIGNEDNNENDNNNDGNDIIF